MQQDRIWQEIDAGRTAIAALLDDLSAPEWDTPSLCRDWTVRDVAAHLTQAHLRLRDIWAPLIRNGLSVPRMTKELATASLLTHDEITAALRDLVGSRRTAVGVTPLEPLLDVLVHGQDIAIPTGRHLPMSLAAAIAAATRTFEYWGPMRFTRRYDDLTFVATDVDWHHGTARDEVRGPIAALLMVLTGRRDPRVSGATAKL